MAVKHIPSLPVGAVLDNLHDTYMVSKMNHPANIAAGWDNFKFLSSAVTGNDGEVYGFSDGEERTEFKDDSGYVQGWPGDLNEGNRFQLVDKVPSEGSYICKMGYVAGLNSDQHQVNHTFMKNVVGFDATFKTFGESTSDVNEPWIGKIGLVYTDVSGNEWIYRPTVTHFGTTGDIPHTPDSDRRVARSFQYDSTAWKDIHEQDLRFTGFIWEWGHGARGGAVKTKLTMHMFHFKPLISYGINSPLAVRSRSNVPHYELVPRARTISEIDMIDFSTHDITY